MKPCPPDCADSCCAWVGGIGGLTPDEEQPWIDLLNGGHPCECGVCDCNNPLVIREPGIRGA